MRVETHLPLAFYACTRTYRPVFDTHGWGEVAERLSALSKDRRWDEMERHVPDEMVDTIAVVAPHDRLAHAVGVRYGGICSRVEFSIGVESADDAEILRGMVNAIHASNTFAEERAPWETRTDV